MTRRKSRQFNYGSHAEINHIEFEDKFLIKTHANVKYFLPVDCWNNFLTSWEETQTETTSECRDTGVIDVKVILYLSEICKVGWPDESYRKFVVVGKQWPRLRENYWISRIQQFIRFSDCRKRYRHQHSSSRMQSITEHLVILLTNIRRKCHGSWSADYCWFGKVPSVLSKMCIGVVAVARTPATKLLIVVWISRGSRAICV